MIRLLDFAWTVFDIFSDILYGPVGSSIINRSVPQSVKDDVRFSARFLIELLYVSNSMLPLSRLSNTELLIYY
jgi:hypothetical protein